MINITRLINGTLAPGDGLRYGTPSQNEEALPPQPKIHYRPVVVWNVIRRCNLHCAHCYTESTDRETPGELTQEQAFKVIDDLARFTIPTLLFSGGEPLLRVDLLRLINRATEKGLRTGLSTNGTLMTPSRALALKNAGLRYIGISIDGIKATNDKLRGKSGAFDKALAGIRTSLEEGFRVSLRFTLTRWNVADLDEIFNLVERERIPRFCIYHLAYAGRGRRILPYDLDGDERRRALDLIIDRARSLRGGGRNVEVLTVANHADAGYILQTLRRTDPGRLATAYNLLKRNGGNSSGTGIACIDNLGFVHPDQFWRTRSLGNVLERPFSQIWQDESNPFLYNLRNRKPLLDSRCRHCNYLDVCNGNLRVRGEAATGSPWGQDPSCYLTDEEVLEGLPSTKVGV